MMENHLFTSKISQLLFIRCLLALFFIPLTLSWGQTTVFSDDFNRGAVLTPLSNGGTPTMTYTTATTSTGTAGSGATSRTNINTGTDYMLQLLSGDNNGTTTTQTQGATYVSGSLSTFSAPYNTKLSSNVGDLTWTFNMRTNRGTALSGFTPPQYGSAVVLASTNSNLAGAGDGYAVIEIKGTTNNTFKLIKYTNGLSGTQTVIIAPTSDFLTTFTSYVSVRVVFKPSTNSWSLYLRNDTTSASVDPSSGVTTQIGSTTTDATYTSSTMTSFGFLWSHSASTAYTSNTALYDNFKVVVNKPTITTPSAPNLTGLNYGAGSGPSGAQSFTTGGVYLTSDITVASATTDFEVSIDNATFSSSLTLSPTSGTVSSPTTIYVRLKAGLSTNTYSGVINITATNATSQSVTCLGTVSSTPTIAVSTASLSAFANTDVGSDSANQSFTVNGSALTANITVTAPANFLISTDNSNFLSSITLNNASGSVLPTTIYTRFRPTGNGLYSGAITIRSTGANEPDISVSGNPTYYYKGSGDLGATSSWNAKQDGTGNLALADFNVNNAYYKILTSATSTATNPWSVAGTDSKIIVGDPSIAGVTLTIASGAPITTSTAVIDIVGASNGSSNSVLLRDTAIPFFGTLHPMSEVHYQANITTATNKSYGKIVVENNAFVTFTGNPVIQTSLFIDSGATLATGDNSGKYFTINSGAIVTINGTFKTQKSAGFVSSTLGTAGGSIQFAGTQLITLGSNSTIEFNRGALSATSTQTIDARTYNNLVLSNSGAASNKTFAAGTLSVSGALTVVDFLGSITQPATSTIIYSGTAPQTLPSAITTYSNLNISGGSTKTLSANTTVSGVLTFNSGKISTGASTLTIGTAGSTIGASSATGWVMGNLKKTTASSTSPTFTYPLGDATNYLPLTLTFTGNTTAAGGITATFTAGEHLQSATSGYNSAKGVNRTWTLTNDALAGFGTYSATFNYAVADNDSGTTPGNYKVNLYQNSEWTALTTTASPNQTAATATGISSFGDFVVAEPNVPQGLALYIDSVSGNDNNDGATSATPWKNISKMNRFTMPPCLKIYLKTGSVWSGQQLKFSGSGTASSPIMVDQYGTGAKPRINGDGIAIANQGVVYLYNQSYIEINNLEITNYPTGITDPDSIFFQAINNGADRRGVMVVIDNYGTSNHIYLKNLDVHHIKGQLGSGEASVNGAVPKRTGGIFFSVLGITETEAAKSRFNDVLIDGCSIYYCENIGIAFDNEWNVYYPGGQNSTIAADVTEYNNWYDRRNSNLKISNNVIHDIGKNAMIIRMADETGLIEKNICYETARGTTGNTMFTARCKGTVFQYNEGSWNRGTTQQVNPGGIDGSMYDADFGSVDVIFQYSFSHDNSEGLFWGCNTRGSSNNTSGIPDPGDKGCTVRYCISQNDKGDLIFFNYPSAGNEIYNNVFYIRSGLNSTKIIHENSDQHTYNFYNNIIYNSGTVSFSFKPTGQTRDFKNNIFYNVTVPIEISSSDDQILLVNPLFVNPGSGTNGINSLEGYKLKGGSPALANGKIISANGGFDYFGNNVSSAAGPNRGAYEGAGFFYSKNGSDLSATSSWGFNTDGSGTPPANFTSNNQGFIIRDVASTLLANWTVSGTNSIVKVGYDAVAGKLAIPNGKTFTLGTGSSMIVSPLSSISCANGSTLNLNDNPISLQSTATGTATVGKIEGTLSGATNVTVERYIPAKRAWRAITAPLIATTVFANWQENGAGKGTYGFDIWNPAGGTGIITGGVNSSLLSYSSSNNNWTGVTDTQQASTLMDGTKNRPFMAFVTGPYGSNNISAGAAETTLRATGTLLTGDQLYPTIGGKYTFIGNPYASPLDLSVMMNNTQNATASFGGNVWVWDANASGRNTVGTYNLYNSGTYSNVTSNTAVGFGTQIQSGQAFFVKSAANATFTIKETHKGSEFTNAVFRTTATELLRVGLYKQVNNEWSGRDGAMTVILADADANQAPNKMANGSENIVFTKNGDNFASNHHLPLVATDVLNVKVWNTTAGANYKLKINTEQFATTNLNATLEDLFANARTALTLDGTAVEYPFTVTTDALSTGDRFRIVFQTAALSTNIPKVNGFSIVPNPVTGDAFQVNLGALPTGNYTYTIWNTLGQEVEKGSINNAAQNTNYTVKFRESAATGMYIMKIKGSDNSVFTAKIIKK